MSLSLHPISYSGDKEHSLVSNLHFAVLVELTHTHTLPVSYVLKGQDATVSFGILDFRLLNNAQGYLFISARTGSNWVRIQLFGIADDSHPALLQPNGYPNHPADLSIDPK